MKGRDFLKLLDYTSEEILELIDLAADLKAKKKAGIPHRLCEGKNIVLLFEKDSTRTRCAFEVAASDLGRGSTDLGPTGNKVLTGTVEEAIRLHTHAIEYDFIATAADKNIAPVGYQVTVYPNGRSDEGASYSALLFLPDVALDATLPSGTWIIGHKCAVASTGGNET